MRHAIPVSRFRSARIQAACACLLVITTAPAIATDEPIGSDERVFGFDAALDNPINPVLTLGDLTARFATDTALSPNGQAVLVTGQGAAPFKGAGHMRLSDAQGNPEARVSVFLDFSAPLASVEMRALSIAGSKLPFSIEYYSGAKGAGTRLGAASPNGFASSPPLPDEYQQLAFSNPRGIRSLRLVGQSNLAYFDQLGVVPLPPGLVVDLEATALEVTQAVQDLNNSVRLVANKRTFVRFHVRSLSSEWRSFAVLHAARGSDEVWLCPMNSPDRHITVLASPDRAQLNDSFVFELPDGFTDGTVTLTGFLNPVLSWRGRSPSEPSYDNNETAVTVTFEAVPQVRLVFYRVSYRRGSSVIIPATFHRAMMLNWLRRAYPLNDLTVWFRTMTLNRQGPPGCDGLNQRLRNRRNLDLLGGWGIGTDARYFGQVDDNSGNDFMRGCAPRPGHVAAGPTGTRNWGWDFDGSFGDWYGGHELGHSYGRRHVDRCNEPGATDDTYGGLISPVATGTDAVYGFDTGYLNSFWQPLTPSWTDVMTYCANQWLSDVTYGALLAKFQDFGGGGGGAGGEITERLLLTGTIVAATNEVRLEPIFSVAAPELARSVPGNYAIVLRDGSGGLLARYAFTPEEVIDDPTDAPSGKDEAVRLLVFEELVPAVAGTTRIEIESRAGGVLHTVRAGGRSPRVRVLSPNGGEVLSGEIHRVAWEADEPDGDPLWFNVSYSRDNGKSWETAATAVEGTHVDLDDVNLSAGTACLFRVLASDGIHTASDDSDAPFVMTNHPPEVKISFPRDGAALLKDETLRFEADGYDIDIGTLGADALVWRSDLGGVIGKGPGISIPYLKPGNHRITVRADDRQSGLASDTVLVSIVDDPTQLPTLDDRLVVSPSALRLRPARGEISERLAIENQNPAISIPWAGASSAPWVTLSAARGMTPQAIILSYQDTGLAPGSYSAVVSFASAAAPGERREVQVKLEVAQPPATEIRFRRGDCNGDGDSGGVGDSIHLLSANFIGGVRISCRAACDVNGDGSISGVLDALTLLTRNFIGGVAIPEPYPSCGPESLPAGIALDCATPPETCRQ